MPEKQPRRAWLGLGGNIGDPVKSMALALTELDRRDDCDIIAVSKLYKTPPWGKTDQAWFFNSCAALKTTLTPQELLGVYLTIERDMKRVRHERWGPRTIDIDVLAMEGITLAGADLTLPHPRMTTRGFVLVPLNDIAPDQIIAGHAVSQWMTMSDRTGIELADENADWWRLAL